MWPHFRASLSLYPSSRLHLEHHIFRHWHRHWTFFILIVLQREERGYERYMVTPRCWVEVYQIKDRIQPNIYEKIYIYIPYDAQKEYYTTYWTYRNITVPNSDNNNYVIFPNTTISDSFVTFSVQPSLAAMLPPLQQSHSLCLLDVLLFRFPFPAYSPVGTDCQT